MICQSIDNNDVILILIKKYQLKLTITHPDILSKVKYKILLNWNQIGNVWNVISPPPQWNV